MRRKLIFIFSLVIALVAAGSVYYYLDNLKKTYQYEGDYIQVVVAKQHIPARTKVLSKMIEIKELPGKYINEKVVNKPEDVVGKLTVSEILPGEILRTEKLANGKDIEDGLAFLVKPGMRAITVAVDDVSGLAGLLRTGDKVDVLGTFSLPASADHENTSYTSFLIQNAEVLSLNQELANSDQPDISGKKQINYKNVTLLVSPTDSQYLTLCSEKGKIRLILRSPDDQNIISIPPVKMSQLIR